MKVVPLTLAQANVAVRQWHRHHKPVVGHRFSLGAMAGDVLVGAVIVGRPKSRMSDQYQIAEVTRLVTDGHKNACSFLYGAAARVAKDMGFWKIQTFILESEPGTSLKAAGWRLINITEGGQWKHTGIAQMRLGQTHGNREDQPTERKQAWIKNLDGRDESQMMAQEFGGGR